MNQTASPVSAAYRYISDVGKSRGHPTHMHPTTIEICYLVEGHMHWWIRNETIEMLAGDLMVVPMREPHGSLDLTLEPCEYISIQVRPDHLPEMARKGTLEGPFAGHHQIDHQAGHWVEQIYREFSSPDSKSVEALRSLACLLAIRLSRRESCTQKRNLSGFVFQAQKVLQQCSMDKAPVDAACRRLEVSKAWICQRFREEMGCGPGTWLRIQRIGVAKRMLFEERRSVAVTAKTLGFSSSQHFSGAFRRETGISPTQYIALRDGQSSGLPDGCLVVEM
jgi:AraC-like DNA-binding protein